MDPRLAAAVSAGKLAGRASRLAGRGGGTAVTGLVAERLAPGLLAGLGRQLGAGSLLVTGTNGKTTTTKLLATILDRAGEPYLTNRTGSNLTRGLVTTLIGASDPLGRLRGAGGRVGLFEVDEATMPAAARALQPRVLVFTNLFRDQLDRYGEVDTVAAMWREALAVTPKTATLVLNADDPSVAALGREWPGSVHWFGVDDPALASETPGAIDARWCASCGGTFEYALRYFGHAGHWRCRGCGWARPTPDTIATNVRLGLETAGFEVAGLGAIELGVTGLYNVINGLAATAAARVLGIAAPAIREGLAAGQAAFGRQEKVQYEGRTLRLLLCKNPAGANQILLWLAALANQGLGPFTVAALLNDNFADGQDVSWIWDVDYEPLAGHVRMAFAGGARADDMALRLTYAGWPEPVVASTPAELLDALVAATPAGADVFVIPTYTAMLELRAELARRGAVAHFWSE
ncbi:MAG: MurT ligase domain-containing protein [Dehalococcoidia bacterium]